MNVNRLQHILYMYIHSDDHYSAIFLQEATEIFFI